MVGRVGALGTLIGAAVGTLFLVPAHGSAQLTASCPDFSWTSETVEVLLLCAQKGDAEAQLWLAAIYDGSALVPEDDAEAVRWYRLAADQGHDGAQYNLGRMYAEGEGVPEDLVFANMWYNLSATQGNETAQMNQDIVEQQMTGEQIAEAQRLSREWRETHPN